MEKEPVGWDRRRCHRLWLVCYVTAFPTACRQMMLYTQGLSYNRGVNSAVEEQEYREMTNKGGNIRMPWALNLELSNL